MKWAIIFCVVAVLMCTVTSLSSSDKAYDLEGSTVKSSGRKRDRIVGHNSSTRSLASAVSSDTEATRFVFAWPLVHQSWNARLYVIISNNQDTEATVNTSSSYPSFSPQTWTVRAKDRLEIDFFKQLQVQYNHEGPYYKGFTMENKGILILCNLPISVVAVERYSSYKYADMGTFLMKPSQTLHTHYFAVTGNPSNVSINVVCQVTAVSSRKPTSVTITLTNGTSKAYALDYLQTLTYSDSANLSGVKVESKDPVAVIASCNCVYKTDCDVSGEMMPPVIEYGTTFPLAAFRSLSYHNTVTVVAASDNTPIFLDNTLQNTIEKSGEVYTFSLNSLSYLGILSSTKPITVSQTSFAYSSSHNYGNPFLVEVPSESQFMGGSCMFSAIIPSTVSDNSQFVNIITQGNIIASMQLNDRLIKGPWTPFGNERFYHITIELNPGNYTVSCTESNGRYTATVYGYGINYNGHGKGYGYLCGMSLPGAPVITTAEPTSSSSSSSSSSTTATTATPTSSTTTETTKKTKTITSTTDDTKSTGTTATSSLASATDASTTQNSTITKSSGSRGLSLGAKLGIIAAVFTFLGGIIAAFALYVQIKRKRAKPKVAHPFPAPDLVPQQLATRGVRCVDADPQQVEGAIYESIDYGDSSYETPDGLKKPPPVPPKPSHSRVSAADTDYTNYGSRSSDASYNMEMDYPRSPDDPAPMLPHIPPVPRLSLPKIPGSNEEESQM